MSQVAVPIQEEKNRALKTPLDRPIKALSHKLGKTPEQVDLFIRFFKFATVGLLGFCIDFGVLNLLLGTVLPPPERANIAIATSCGFVAAASSNFFWNRYWTYPDSRSKSILVQFVMFFVISVIGWLGRTTWVTLSFSALGAFAVSMIQNFSPEYTISAIGSDQLGANIASFIGVCVVLIWNFFANRFLTYNDIDKDKKKTS